MKWALLLALQFSCLGLFGQNKGIRNHEFSLTLGSYGTHIQSFPITQRFDFLNYVDPYFDALDNTTIRLGYRFDFLAKMSADVKLMLMSDLLPNSYDISVYYQIDEKRAIGIGSMLYKNYISDFLEFHEDKFPDYYVTGGNYNQILSYDLGFYLTPTYNEEINNRLTMLLKCDLGLSTFVNGELEYQLKKQFSNERISYQYKARIAFQPFINPKIELRYEALSFESTSFGLLFNSNFFYSIRSMDYDKTVTPWVQELAITEMIRTRKHNYSRFEAYLGLYLRL